MSQSDRSQDTTMSEEDILLTFHRTHVIMSEKESQGIFRQIDKAEEEYRQSGTLFHTTSFPARWSPRISPDAMQRLQAAYMDYNAWREPWIKLQQLAQKALLEARPNGTPEALKARALAAYDIEKQVMSISYGDDPEEEGGLLGDAEQLKEDLEALRAEDRRLENAGLVTSWYLFDDNADKARGYRLPAIKGDEWEIFREWVYTLPETRRMMTNPTDPASLDKCASRMLYRTPKAFWDAHWNAPALESGSDDGRIFPGPYMDALRPNNGGDDSPTSTPVAEGERVFEVEELDVLYDGDHPAMASNDPPVAALPAPPANTPRPLGTSHPIPGRQVVEDGFI